MYPADHGIDMPPEVKAKTLKVLFLSQRFLYPMDTGGKIRTGKMLDKLSDLFEVTLVSNVESPKDDLYLGEIKNLCHQFHPVPWKEVKKYTLSFYLRLLMQMTSRYPVTVLNDYSRDIETRLHHLIAQESFDLVICDFVQSSLNFKHIKNVKTLLFQHNVESEIVNRHIKTNKNPIIKLFWWLQYVKMYRYEKAMCQKFNGVVAVSELDRQYMQTRYQAPHVFAIPTGVDTENLVPQEAEPEANSLIFTGSMDWLPNEDAILFFVQQILPRIRRVIPDVKLSVVGRNPSPYLRQKLSGEDAVDLVGWVEDVRPFIARHALYVVPLRIGGGTRIKVYEAMAMGKAMVSTPIGTEGLPVEPGKHVWLAAEAEDFAEAVIHLLQDRSARRQLEVEARRFVERHCSWDRAAAVFADICRRVAEG